MIVIGLCGGSGSGKTSVCQTVLSRGIPVFASDDEYHRLIGAPSDCTRALAAAFGDKVLNKQGGIDRRAVSRLVFSDRPDAKDNLRRLNEIAHQYVCEAFLTWKHRQEKEGADIVVLEAPLLFESGMNRLCTVTVAVTAPKEIRIARIVARDGITEQEAAARIEAQCSDEVLTRLCDYTVQNTGTMNEVQDRINQLFNQILNDRG